MGGKATHQRHHGGARVRATEGLMGDLITEVSFLADDWLTVMKSQTNFRATSYRRWEATYISRDQATSSWRWKRICIYYGVIYDI